MKTFYKPFVLKIGMIRSINYPMLGLEKLNNITEIALIDHLKDLFSKFDLGDNAYQLIIIWTDGKDLMTDHWLFTEIESENTGYTVDCRTFRNFAETKGEGLSASDGLIMLGRETELSESIRKSGGSVDDYLEAERPNIPGGLVSAESI